MADSIGGSGGSGLPPISARISSFSWSFWEQNGQIIGWRSPSGLPPPPGNPWTGSFCHVLLITRQTFSRSMSGLQQKPAYPLHKILWITVYLLQKLLIFQTKTHLDPNTYQDHLLCNIKLCEREGSSFRKVNNKHLGTKDIKQVHCSF